MMFFLYNMLLLAYCFLLSAFRIFLLLTCLSHGITKHRHLQFLSSEFLKKNIISHGGKKARNKN